MTAMKDAQQSFLARELREHGLDHRMEVCPSISTCQTRRCSNVSIPWSEAGWLHSPLTIRHEKEKVDLEGVVTFEHAQMTSGCDYSIPS